MAKAVKKAQYYIGIDLGTTNCTMSYCKIPQEGAKEIEEIAQFSIPQLASLEEKKPAFSLPSFLYFPTTEERGKMEAVADGHQGYFCGFFAKEKAGQMAGRVVSSAKSWLCHDAVDRRSPLLPLQSAEEITKISPVEASAFLLSHLQRSWDELHPEANFSLQKIFITVPASFDPAACQLVQEAASLAKYPEIILLEEPQAAFYSWLYRHKESWRDTLKVGDTILVADIGGGTTDFTLIAVAEKEGELLLERVAVGAHLLLGGDNIDLALAYFAAEKLEKEGHLLDEWQQQQLIHSCRSAKELLLSENSWESAPVTVMGRATRLIGGTLTTNISKDEINQIVLEGFAPIVEPLERAKVEKKAGMQQIGLPYVKDPRITAQLAKFLSMTGDSDSGSVENFIAPTAVLFNGGMLHAAALRHRLLLQLNHWAKSLGKPDVVELSQPDFDYAVGKGAVYYGQARQGNAIRIRSGTSRSYFIGVEEAAPAVPGIAPPLRAVCIAPFGMEEGTEQQLDGQQFALVLGELATFRFFSRATPLLSDGTAPFCGKVIKRWKEELTELHPIETVLQKEVGDAKTVQVTLITRVTELGQLEVWCISPEGRKWKLEFDIRSGAENSMAAAAL